MVYSQKIVKLVPKFRI